jgi:hypothetical protein
MGQTASGFAPLRNRSVAVRGGVAVVVSVALNALLVVAANAVDLAPGFESLVLMNVAGLSAIGAIGATVVYALLGRYVADPDGTFLRVSAAVLLLSFLPNVGVLAEVEPLADPNATTPAVVLLMFMHVVVAAACVWSLAYAD